MSRAVLMAGASGALGVLAAWEALRLVPGGGPALRRLLAPLHRAGDLGQAPTVAERRRLAALAGAAALAAGWLVGGPVVALALATTGPAAVGALVGLRRRRWRTALAEGAPSVARALADALAGGHSVRGAISEAAGSDGVPGPAGVELRTAARGLSLGEPTDVALERWRRRADAPAYDTIVAAILLQRDAGGDLARLLRDLAGSLEAAARLAREARSVTAQARFTGGLVAAMPAGAAALAELASPGYIASLLGSPLTAAMLLAALALQAAGLLAIRRMGRLRT